MFAKEPPEGWMAECREQWLSRLREESPAAPTDQAAAPSQAGHSSAAVPWEHAGNPLLTSCARPRCGSCGIILKTGELMCPFCPPRAPGSDESAPPESPGSSGAAHVGSANEEDMAELRRRRRKVQMRLVSLRRGDVRSWPG